MCSVPRSATTSSRRTRSTTYLDAVDAASGRVRTGSYGTTEEGRDLRYAVVGPAAAITDQSLADAADAIRTIQDPATSDDDARLIAETTRPFLFIGGNVHGNEESGADASVKLLWHLADRTDCAARRIRDAATVVILPMQNPDGRELGYRRNANGFDMNRDGQVRTQVEISGRWDLMRQLPPQLFVDAHEFGYYRSFFPPNDDPIYHETSSQVLRWIEDRLGPALADLFDERGWRLLQRGRLRLLRADLRRHRPRLRVPGAGADAGDLQRRADPVADAQELRPVLGAPADRGRRTR